nr:DnaB-like helicase N-terminal domain-containing protein [Streptomyces sp. SID4926]
MDRRPPPAGLPPPAPPRPQLPARRTQHSFLRSHPVQTVRQLDHRATADNDGLPLTPPPGDPDSERALLAACIHDKHRREYDEAAAIITRDDFTVPAYAALWDVLGDQIRDQRPTDPDTLRVELDRRGELRPFGPGGGHLHEIADSYSGGSAEYFAEAIRRTSRLRNLDDLTTRIKAGIHTGRDLEELEALITRHVDDRATTPAAGGSRFVDGASFILDLPADVPANWGEGDNVLWAEGEALLIAGPAGVGKTTIAQQVVLAAIGLRPHALGYPVRPVKRFLYLASDRPAQAARSFARMVSEEDRDIVRDRLVFWKGPPPSDFIKDPGTLLRLCRQAGADAVCLDSLKDMAGELASEEGGQAINSAIQRTLVEGIEVLGLHHHRKQGGGKDSGREPTSLDELYGSTWITAGAGSVVSLYGAAGDPIVNLRHLKQPAGECGPWRLKHDHPRGHTDIWHEVDVLDVLAHARGPLTAQQLAIQIYGGEKGKATASETEKARRRLDQLVEKGLAHKIANGGGRGAQAGYVAAFSPNGELPESA